MICGEGSRSLWRRLLDFTQAKPIREGQLRVYERLQNQYAKPIREASGVAQILSKPPFRQILTMLHHLHTTVAGRR